MHQIRQRLKENIDPEYKVFLSEMIPTSQKVMGVRMPVINEIVKEFKHGGIALVELLWKNGSHEEKLIAAKILGKYAKKNPDKTLQLVYDYSAGLYDWAICDTLATQTLKPIVKIHKKEIWEMSDEFILSKNPWQRRFALVLIEYYCRFPEDHSRIKKQIKKVESDTEFYVKKAIAWLKREIVKSMN